MVKDRQGLAWIWIEIGREPLALVQLVLLHPAEYCTEGPLNAHKGNTEWIMGLIVAGEWQVA